MQARGLESRGATRSGAPMSEETLNRVLTRLGYTTRPAAFYRKDILRDGEVVLRNAFAGEVWAWLRERGEIE